jgi:hypothetical protein
LFFIVKPPEKIHEKIQGKTSDFPLKNYSCRVYEGAKSNLTHNFTCLKSPGKGYQPGSDAILRKFMLEAAAHGQGCRADACAALPAVGYDAPPSQPLEISYRSAHCPCA